jgi:hypothetical protein
MPLADFSTEAVVVLDTLIFSGGGALAGAIACLVLRGSSRTVPRWLLVATTVLGTICAMTLVVIAIATAT